MNAKQTATLLATVLFATAAYSSENPHHNMQVGDNRSVVDKNGRSILVTRAEENFSFDIDGKTIDAATQQIIRTALESTGHETY